MATRTATITEYRLCMTIVATILRKKNEREEYQMNPTGIVRRVDDFGRILIPREIRRILGIKESDPMEIFIDGEDIIIRKYKEESEE